VTALVDAAKVERIVENMVANAVKHTGPGTRIVVSVSADGDDSAVIRVDDEGPGVAEGDKTSIFELFSRAPQTGNDVPGAGVGLALVAQFAALHDGEAWVEDGANGGASFRVRLPRRTP
jgi:signal transduction histidine kinase